MSVESGAPVAVVDWIAANAIPIATTQPGSDLDDLRRLRVTIGDARVVALGEATHGTREFFQLKHRMLEYLVTDLGFDVFAIEATMPEAFDVNEYVLTGEGDPEKALAGLYFWTWDTREVLALIEWMRRWNADPAHARKVKFYGIDMQMAPRAVKVTLEYLRKVDPRFAKQADKELAELGHPFLTHVATSMGYTGTGPEKAGRLVRIDRIVRRFDERERPWSARTGAKAFAIARQHARIVQQHAELAFGAPQPHSVRDRSMAENVQWILANERPDSRVVVWAHNGHVANASDSTYDMGAHLRRALGDDLVVFGFSFYEGSFRARVVTSDSTEWPLRRVTVEGSPRGGLDETFARAGIETFVLDFRSLPSEGEVARWFADAHETYNIGATYNTALAANFRSSERVAALYDAILFVKTTTSARPTAHGERPLPQKLDSPTNLDFEDTGREPVDGWTAVDNEDVHGYRTRAASGDVRSGKTALVIESTGERRYGEWWGGASQTVAARAYRGRRVRVRAAARLEPTAQGSCEAFLWVGHSPPAAGHRARIHRPITEREWRDYEVEVYVPAKPGELAYGIAFVGHGRAFLDDVRIEALP